jgi:hypothetical protein
MTTKITRNSIKCRACGDIITSTHVHDFKWCSCESIFVDGGCEYLRRGGKLELIEELSVEEDDY